MWKKKKKKKHTEVWESEALQFCYFAQIHKWQHAGRYAKACSLPEQEEGPPILGKLFTGFKSWFKPGESQLVRKESLLFPHVEAPSWVQGSQTNPTFSGST